MVEMELWFRMHQVAELHNEMDTTKKDCSNARASLQAALQDIEDLRTERNKQLNALQETQDHAAQLEVDIQSRSNERTDLSEQLKVPGAFRIDLVIIVSLAAL